MSDSGRSKKSQAVSFDAATSIPRQSSFSPSDAGSLTDSAMETEGPDFNGYEIMPIPGFVIKTKRVSGEKVFVNICEHSDVPAVSTSMGTIKSNLKWPIIISSGKRTESGVDEKSSRKTGKEEEFIVYDIIVNPSVLLMSSADESWSTRDLVL